MKYIEIVSWPNTIIAKDKGMLFRLCNLLFKIHCKAILFKLKLQL